MNLLLRRFFDGEVFGTFEVLFVVVSEELFVVVVFVVDCLNSNSDRRHLSRCGDGELLSAVGVYILLRGLGYNTKFAEVVVSDNGRYAIAFRLS